MFILEENQNKTAFKQSAILLKAEFTSPVKADGNKLSAIIKTSSNEKLQLNYTIANEHEKEKLLSSLKIGTICTLQGELSSPNESRNENAFNYQAYLYKQKIHWLFHPFTLTLSQCFQKKVTFHQQLLVIREKGIKFIGQYFDGTSKGIVEALIFGERDHIEPDVQKAYQALGIVHLLAISGLHVGMLTAMLYYLGIRLGITRELVLILLIGFLPFYMILAGGAPSVTRASLMSIFVCISLRRKAKLASIDAISISCIVLLVINPYILFQVGFQLSYLVSLGLILSTRIIAYYRSFLGKVLAITIIAQLISLPVILYYFFEFSLLSIPLNIIFVPLYTFLLLPLAFVTLLFLVIFKPIGEMAAFSVSLLINKTNELVVAISQMSEFTITLGKPSFEFFILYYASICSCFVYWERKRMIRKAFCFPIAVIIFHFVSPYIDPYGEIAILDVGQGDCIYIELPYRKAVYLIDTGGAYNFSTEEWAKRRDPYSVGEDIVVPFLKAKGVKEITKLIITHGDLDHIGGAADILRKVRTDTVIVGAGINEMAAGKAVMEIANKNRIPVKRMKQGDSWSVGGYFFYVLSPNVISDTANKNNQSIVIFTKLGGVRWLFTGDLEAEGEKNLIENYQLLKVDILKVGHHGSDTSTTDFFLQAIKPKVALISVGKGNRYKHPSRKVISRLKKAQVEILRTDQHGEIRYIFLQRSGTFTEPTP